MSTPTAYQRVGNVAVTPSDYDWQNFPLYVKYDGSDDWLRTASIDFSGTDKMSVFAGVRKLSDVAGMVVELSTSYAYNGMFYLVAGESSSSRYSSLGRGTTGLENAAALFSASGYAPDTAVLAATHDIAGDLSTIRRNGVSGTNATGDKGTGNFGNHAMYIGRRAGSSLPFNGRLYSLIVRGALTDAGTIALAETYVAAKSGVTL